MVQIGDQTTTTATTTTAWPPTPEPCSSRLPCGLCLITYQMCPKYVEPMTIRWNEVTCKQMEVEK